MLLKDKALLRRYLNLVDTLVPQMVQMKKAEEVLECPEFSKIVKLGEPLLKVLLDDIKHLQEAPLYHECQMLMVDAIAKKIGKEPPVIPPDHQDSLVFKANHYIGWGHEHSYLQYRARSQEA